MNTANKTNMDIIDIKDPVVKVGTQSFTLDLNWIPIFPVDNEPLFI